MHLQPDARIAFDISDVAGLHAVFGDDPELVADASVPHWSATRLSTPAPECLK
jgi:hypothetical protein